MSIATEITRLQTAKSDLKTAIEAKGVTVPSSATIDTYDDYVSQISGGGGQAEQDLKGMVERSATAITIPSGTTTIGSYVFNHYSSLRSVNIPDTVTTIGEYALAECTGLISVTIPDSLTSIGQNAFSYCSSLTSINIPSGVTSIANRVFYSCSHLQSINIPSGVTSIANRVFYGCSHLQSITINATTPPTLGSNVFDNTSIAFGTGYIYVPSASVNTYKSASGWSTYADRIQAIP